MQEGSGDEEGTRSNRLGWSRESKERKQPNTTEFSTLCTRPSGLASLLCDLPLPPAVEKVPRARGVLQWRPVGGREQQEGLRGQQGHGLSSGLGRGLSAEPGWEPGPASHRGGEAKRRREAPGRRGRHTRGPKLSLARRPSPEPRQAEAAPLPAPAGGCAAARPPRHVALAAGAGPAPRRRVPRLSRRPAW